LIPKETSVFLAVFSASGDSATKQLIGLSSRGFVLGMAEEESFIACQSSLIIIACSFGETD